MPENMQSKSFTSAKSPLLRAPVAKPKRQTRVTGTRADTIVSELPPPPAGFRQVEVTSIIPERAWARTLYDEEHHSHLYQVIEPELSADEKEVLAFLRDTLVRTLDGRIASQDKAPDIVLIEAVQQAVLDHSIRVSDAGAKRLEYYMLRDFLGYGAIDVMMRDGMIEDISCDGPGIPLYLFHRTYESIKTTVRFSDEDELDSFVIRLAQRSRKHISVADPLLDATLPDGSRLQATLSREVTTRGSSFTIRKFRADPMTPPDLMRLNTFNAEMAAWFWFAMELGHSFILAGGTASGKTTSLNAILQFIPPARKVVSIEDTREINLSHENWIAGLTRTGFSGTKNQGGVSAGTIDMYKLLEAALRQRPEYLIVGEVRGPEALTLFQAMATGHAVYSTMHADSVPSAVYRLENPPINVPRMMLQTIDIIAIQAQVRIGNRMTRRIREVTEVVGLDPETRELLTNTVFEWDPATDHHKYLGKSAILEQIMDARSMTQEQVEAEWHRRVQLLTDMQSHGIRHVGDVARILARYYLRPDEALAAVHAGAVKPSAPQMVTKPTVPKPLDVSEPKGPRPRVDAALASPAVTAARTAPASPPATRPTPSGLHPEAHDALLGAGPPPSHPASPAPAAATAHAPAHAAAAAPLHAAGSTPMPSGAHAATHADTHEGRHAAPHDAAPAHAMPVHESPHAAPQRAAAGAHPVSHDAPHGPAAHAAPPAPAKPAPRKSPLATPSRLPPPPAPAAREKLVEFHEAKSPAPGSPVRHPLASPAKPASAPKSTKRETAKDTRKAPTKDAKRPSAKPDKPGG